MHPREPWFALGAVIMFSSAVFVKPFVGRPATAAACWGSPSGRRRQTWVELASSTVLPPAQTRSLGNLVGAADEKASRGERTERTVRLVRRRPQRLHSGLAWRKKYAKANGWQWKGRLALAERLGDAQTCECELGTGIWPRTAARGSHRRQTRSRLGQMGLCVNETAGTVVTGLSHVRRIWSGFARCKDDHVLQWGGWSGAVVLWRHWVRRFVEWWVLGEGRRH
jgi:hypothetical protein